MDLLLNYIPRTLAVLIGPVSLIIVGWMVEENFVGRVTAFSNSIAINLALYQLPNLSNGLVLYANFTLVLGFVGFIAYNMDESLPSIYYDLAWLNSSIGAALVLIYVLIGTPPLPI